MTTPSERTRAVMATCEFLLDLIQPTVTPKVPRAIRERATRCLRHYPGSFDLRVASDASPNTFGRPE